MSKSGEFKKFFCSYPKSASQTDLLVCLKEAVTDIMARLNYGDVSRGEIIALPGMLNEIREFTRLCYEGYHGLCHTSCRAAHICSGIQQQPHPDSCLLQELSQMLTVRTQEIYQASQDSPEDSSQPSNHLPSDEIVADPDSILGREEVER